MIGTVDNGRKAQLVSLSYRGEVSVRDCSDHLELCYFGAAPEKTAFVARLDGEQIAVSSVVTRNLSRIKARPTD